MQNVYPTFELLTVKTAPSSFSWDTGSITLTSDSRLVNALIDENGDYIGYAPFVFLQLSSIPVFIDTGEPPIYWNWDTLVCEEYNCSIFEDDMSINPIKWDDTEVGSILQKTWNQSLTSCLYGAQLNFSDCSTDTAKTYKVLRVVRFQDYYNNATNQLTSLSLSSQTFSHVYMMPGTYLPNMTFVEFISSNPSSMEPNTIYEEDFSSYPKDIPFIDFETPVYALSTIRLNTVRKLKVLEIPLMATLSSTPYTPGTMVSPLSTRITARATKTGSFPIERIVWDLGDGSPLLTQRRWSINNNVPFVYNGAFPSDPNDPRNYDVIHTYKITQSVGSSFYPSITAYAYSTGTQDSAFVTVGPIRPNQMNESLKVLQNYTNVDNTVTTLFQINNEVVTAKLV